MPYDRTAPRIRPEDRHVRLNITLPPQSAAILRAFPERERGKALDAAIRAMYHPDEAKQRFARLQALLIAVMQDES